MATDLSNTIPNFVQISDQIATAGQPTEVQFAEIRNAGYQTVINLAMTTSTNAIPHEQQVVEAQQMNYVHIPVLWQDPKPEDFDRFVQALQANEGQKVFIHCALNMRVSAFVYLYRRIIKHIDNTVAEQTLHQIWTPNETWQAFIQEVLQSYGDRNDDAIGF